MIQNKQKMKQQNKNLKEDKQHVKVLLKDNRVYNNYKQKKKINCCKVQFDAKIDII